MIINEVHPIVYPISKFQPKVNIRDDQQLSQNLVTWEGLDDTNATR